MILAGDVGGTTTRLALYEPGTPARAPVLESRLASRDWPDLESLVRSFAANAPGRLDRVVLGIAGPVVDQRVEAINLPWRIAAAPLERALDAPVLLVNDLEATAFGLGLLTDADVETLRAGAPVPGNRALIAAGTGLGEALLVPGDDGWRPSASEGGHADFAPGDETEDELWAWLRARYGHVSWERVLSGPGLADLYRFHAETGRGEASPEVARRFESAPDPAVVVTEAALAGACGRARLAVERFVSIYGAEAGNLALKALAVNGVYVGGGIAPRILPFLRDGRFLEAFTAKGRLTALMTRIPVRIVTDDRAGLWGAYARAQEEEAKAQ